MQVEARVMGRPGAVRRSGGGYRTRLAPDAAPASRSRRVPCRRRRGRAQARPGCTRRSGRGRAAARGSRSSRARRSRSPRATGRRAGWRPRSTPTTTSTLHLDDTLAAGRGAASRDAWPRSSAPRRPSGCASWSERGIPFDRSPGGELLLSLEGGHTRRRVAHAGGSATGRHVTATRCRSSSPPHDRDRGARAQLRATRCGSRSGRCVRRRDRVGRHPGRATVLAPGGAAALWQRTTNPRGRDRLRA